MFKREYLSSYITWGIISAVAFCIPMIIFLTQKNYTATWWLFLGNGLFLVSIVAYMLAFNKRQNENASTQTMVARSEEHTSELQSHVNLVCRLLLEKKKKKKIRYLTCTTKIYM